MADLNRFKEIFWDAFHKPKLETEKFLEIWEGLEPVNDMLAGPFYCIYSNDQCDYVFKDKVRFPGIFTADDFLDFCHHFIQLYREKIEKAEAASEEEKTDKQLLLYQVDIKMELADIAYSIQKNRINLQDKE